MPNVLSDQALRELREVAKRVLREEVHFISRALPPPAFTGLNNYILQAGTAGITERTTDTDTAGSGEAKILFRSTGGVLTDTSQTTTVYNPTRTPIAADSFINAVQDVYGSYWVAGPGQSAIQYGKPQNGHASGNLATYDLYHIDATGMNWVSTGRELAGVFQKTGYSFSSDVVHVIWPAPGAGPYRLTSWPIELLDCEAGQLNIGSRTKLTISGGAITKTGSYHRVETEASAATDDLTDIAGGNEGDILVLNAFNGARTVVCKDNGGTAPDILRLAGGDFSLDTTQDALVLVHSGLAWQEVSRSNNN